MSIHVGSGDGDDGHLTWLIGRPWDATVAGGGGAKGAAGGGGGGGVAYGAWRKVRRFVTARVRSQIAEDISAGERTGAASAPRAAVPAATGPEVAGGGGGWCGGGCDAVAGKAVVTAAVVVGRPEELIEPKQSDTKLVEARVLPGLGRRL